MQKQTTKQPNKPTIKQIKRKANKQKETKAMVAVTGQHGAGIGVCCNQARSGDFEFGFS
jgi:hypothetical protein